MEKAKVYDLEFVFDYRDDYARLIDIINVVVENVKIFKEKNQYPLNLSLEMRFMTYRYLFCIFDEIDYKNYTTQ